VTPTLHDYATQLLEACPALSSASSCMKSRERREGGRRGESGDGGQENSRLTIITGALRSLSVHSLSFHCSSYPPFHYFSLSFTPVVRTLGTLLNLFLSFFSSVMLYYRVREGSDREVRCDCGVSGRHYTSFSRASPVIPFYPLLFFRYLLVLFNFCSLVLLLPFFFLFLLFYHQHEGRTSK
jgi:hypothetical protein